VTGEPGPWGELAAEGDGLVLTGCTGAVAVVQLNRPDVRNALSPEMMEIQRDINAGTYELR
jgi:1,4-dihydroxy-2-naphthoyl-CoA synthase